MRKRLFLLDNLRGIAVFFMVLYHAYYDLVYIFGFGSFALGDNGERIASGLIASVFILVSGFCTVFSRNNLRRGVVCLSAGLLLSAVTFFLPDLFIAFGILHCLGSCMIIFSAAEKAPAIPPAPGLIASLLLFLSAFNLPRGSLIFEKIILPRALYTTKFLFPLGFPGPGFASSDYYPLLPWIFLFFAGAFAGKLWKTGVFKLPDVKKSRFFGFLGNHAFVIYLLHQPIVYAVMYAVTKVLA